MRLTDKQKAEVVTDFRAFKSKSEIAKKFKGYKDKNFTNYFIFASGYVIMLL